MTFKDTLENCILTGNDQCITWNNGEYRFYYSPARSGYFSIHCIYPGKNSSDVVVFQQTLLYGEVTPIIFNYSKKAQSADGIISNALKKLFPEARIVLIN